MGKSYRINLKLNLEADIDLVEWIEGHEHGQRSAEIRRVLRVGIGLLPPPPPDGLAIAEMVREAVAEALAGLQLVAEQHGVSFDSNQVGKAFGNQLDQLLDRFG